MSLGLDLGLPLGGPSLSSGEFLRQFFTADGTATEGSFDEVTLKGDFKIKFKAVVSSAAAFRVLLVQAVAGSASHLIGFNASGDLVLRIGDTSDTGFGSVTQNKLLSFEIVRSGYDVTARIDGVQQGTTKQLPGDFILNQVGQNNGGSFFDNIISDLEIIDLDQPSTRDVLTLGGVNEYGSIPAWVPATDFAIEGEYLTTAPTTVALIVDGRSSGPFNGINLEQRTDGTIRFGAWNAGVASTHITSSVLTSGQLHRFKMVYIGGTMELFLDEVSQGTLAFAIGAISVEAIGALISGASVIEGNLLDVKLHDLATPSNSRRYRMDVESNTTIVNDYDAGTNDLTLNNVISSDWETMSRDTATGEWRNGGNIVINGDFSNGITGWLDNANSEVIDGELRNTTTADFTESNTQSIPLVVGRPYVYKIAHRNGTSTISRVQATGGSGTINFTNNTGVMRTDQATFIATTTTMSVTVYGTVGTSFYDDVSVIDAIADSNYTIPTSTLWRMDQGRFGTGAYELDARSVLGGELVTNGGFDTDLTGWSTTTYNTDASVVSGKAELTIGAGKTFGRLSQAQTTVIGATYILSSDVTKVSGANGVQLKVSNTANLDGAFVNSVLVTTAAAVTVAFTATATTTYIGPSQQGSPGDVSTADNITIREAPNALSLSNVVAGDWEQFTLHSRDWLGGELVVNGGFDADTDWTKGTGWTISGGTATKIGGGGTELKQSGILTAATSYRISHTVISTTGAMNLVMGGTFHPAGVTVGVNTTVRLSGAGADLGFQGGADYDIDNISAKRILESN